MLCIVSTLLADQQSSSAVCSVTGVPPLWCVCGGEARQGTHWYVQPHRHTGTQAQVCRHSHTVTQSHSHIDTQSHSHTFSEAWTCR